MVKTLQEVKKDYDKFLSGFIQQNTYHPVIDGSARSIINLVDERSLKSGRTRFRCFFPYRLVVPKCKFESSSRLDWSRYE